MKIHESLTKPEQVSFDITLEPPRKPQEGSELRSKLSVFTRRKIEERLAKEVRQREVREKTRYCRGAQHPKSKERTARLRKEKNWAKDPFSLVIRGYGSHSIDRKLWDRHIAPFWKLYNPKDLTVKKYRFDYDKTVCGTRVRPFTVYTMDVIHIRLGVLYRGMDQLLFDLSCPIDPQLPKEA